MHNEAQQRPQWQEWLDRAIRERNPLTREAVYRQGWAACPDSPEYACAFADFLHEDRHLDDEAIEVYRRALELAPANAQACAELGDLLQKKAPDEAEQLYRRATASAPDMSDYIDRLACFLYHQRDKKDEAIRLWRDGIDRVPEYYLGRSLIYRYCDEDRNYGEAERVYLHALECHPGCMDLANLLGEVYTDYLSRPDDAERIYRQVLAHAPDNADSIHTVARFLGDKRGKNPEATELFVQAIDRRPDDPELARNFVSYLIDYGDLDDAERWGLRFVERWPSDACLVSQLASAYDSKKEYEKAADLYRRAVALANDAFAPLHLARVLDQHLNQDEEAERWYRRAVELAPGWIGALSAYADFLCRKGQRHEEAKALYRTALEQNLRDWCLASCFARLLDKVLGDYDEAEQWYRKAWELSWEYALSEYAEFLHKVRGRHDEAEQLFRRALEDKHGGQYAAELYADFLRDIRSESPGRA